MRGLLQIFRFSYWISPHNSSVCIFILMKASKIVLKLNTQLICIYPNMKPYNLYLTVIYPLTYILKICNIFLKSEYVIRKICVCLAEEAGQCTSSFPFCHPYVLLPLYLASVFLTHWRNEWIWGNSRFDHPFMPILLCCNTSGLTGVSLDLVQVKGRISTYACPTWP